MIISFIGHGYVGLVTAAVFADLGNTVWCVGRTKEKIDNLKKGVMPFFEPGLKELVEKNFQAGRLKFTISYEEAIPNSEVVFICVGTPSLVNGDADLSQVFKASEEIASNLVKKTVIVVKSTVPIGTTKQVEAIIKKFKSRNNTDFEVAFVPEFLKEGTALSDTLSPDRIVIGSQDERSQKILIELHRPLMKTNNGFVLTSISSAETIKYAANSLLAAKISFANAMSFLCEKEGADVEQVLQGIGLDKRLGRSFLYPGVGYGGSCFPKDVKALISIFKKNKLNASFFEAVEEINKQAIVNFTAKITKFFGKNLKGKTLTVLGLSFKPNTDDMREAPSVKIIDFLQKKGAIIHCFDPIAMLSAQKILKNVLYFDSPEKAVKDTDAFLIITEWNEFRQLNLLKIKTLMKKPVIFDGRNIYDPKEIKKLGFIYYGVGRETS